MTGCWVAWKCLVACLLGESSQQPTWPHVRQIRKCSHSLPLLRHSSQPSALGVTVRMPAMWVQPFANRSDLFRVEDNHLGAAKAGLNRCEIVKTQHRDQMERRRSRRRRDGTLADPELLQARDFLRERDMSLGIMFVESSRIFWRFVQYDDFGHCVFSL